MGTPAWYLRSGIDPTVRAPREIIGLRLIGTGMLALCVGLGFTGHPRAGFVGEGLAILVLTVAWAVVAVVLVGGRLMRTPRAPWFIAAITVLAAALAVLQPHGLWNATPYFIASVTALIRPGRRSALTFVLSTGTVLGASALAGYGDSALGILTGVVPWFLFMRVMQRVREEHEVTKGLVRELEASRAAEATAAAESERARVAREMHDVLAHSLSSLALQLESTRMLARSRDVDSEIVDAVTRAHGIASGGLEEARRAIGALRGEDLPGPDRLPDLVDAFRAETGIATRLHVEGEPRALQGDARLAVYRAAQEALTNVRRHAAEPSAVDLTLTWGADRVRLEVADHVPATVPAGVTPLTNAGGGYGLTGMRERAALLHGTVEAGPTGDGFRVALELPAPSPAVEGRG